MRFFSLCNMRKRRYPDPELAHREREFMIKECHFPEKSITQKGNRLYITFPFRPGKLEEYTGIYYTEGEKRLFALHLEEPMNNILNALEEELMTDKAVRRKGNLEKYKKIFRRIEVKESNLSFEKETKNTVVAITEIKKIPLGDKGHLSGDFLEYSFEYLIQPFMYVVEKHKLTS